MCCWGLSDFSISEPKAVLQSPLCLLSIGPLKFRANPIEALNPTTPSRIQNVEPSKHCLIAGQDPDHRDAPLNEAP